MGGYVAFRAGRTARCEGRSSEVWGGVAGSFWDSWNECALWGVIGLQSFEDGSSFFLHDGVGKVQRTLLEMLCQAPK